MQSSIIRDSSIRFNVNMFSRFFFSENKFYLGKKGWECEGTKTMRQNKGEREIDLQVKVKPWVT